MSSSLNKFNRCEIRMRTPSTDFDAALPEAVIVALLAPYAALSPKELLTIREYIILCFSTSRSEKTSNPADWTAIEREAHNNADWEVFSRARGYTEEEIETFRLFVAAASRVELLIGTDHAQGLACEIHCLAKGRDDR